MSLPAQALSVRLWGIKEEEGHEHEARKSLKKLTEDGNVFGFAVTVVRVPTKLTRRVYTGAMETDKRPAVVLRNIHAGFSLTVELCLKDVVTFSPDDFKQKGIGRQEAGDEESLLSKDEAVEECRKLQQCLEDAFGSLLRVFNYPPKVIQPKYTDKKELDFSRKVQIDDEAEKKIEDSKKTKIAVTVDVIKSKDAVIGGSIIDVDSDDEYDEAEVYLKVGIPKPISPRVLKPKLTKIAKTTKTSVNFKREKKKVTKLSIILEEDGETVSAVELEEGEKRKADKLSLSSDEKKVTVTGASDDIGVDVDSPKKDVKKSSVCNFMKIGFSTSQF